MKLYNSDLSPFCARVRYVIRSKGVPVEIIQDVDSHSQQFIQAVNPLGKLPAFLTLCERHIYESDTICEYLEQLYPGPIFRSFLPADPYLRSRTRILTRINDLYLQPEYSEVLYVRAEPARLALAFSRFDKHFDIIEKLLADVFPAENPYDLPSAGPFVCGKKITLGDVALGTSLVLALDFFPKVKYDVFKGRERLAAWWEAMNRDREFAFTRKEMEENLKVVRDRNRKLKQEQAQKGKL